jgi:hypothetical protein
VIARLHPEPATSPTRFALVTAAWLLGLSALIRLTVVQHHVLMPLARAQGWLAAGGARPAAPAVVITPECSGGDLAALLLAVVLAFRRPGHGAWAPRSAAWACSWP